MLLSVIPYIIVCIEYKYWVSYYIIRKIIVKYVIKHLIKKKSCLNMQRKNITSLL